MSDTPTNPNDLYMMVGEIRSDVKKLLNAQATTDTRVGSLERKFWTAVGSFAVLMPFLPAAVGIPTAVAQALGLH